MKTPDISLTMQTAYADLLDRCANAAFEEAFAEDGTFVSKIVSGRTYWYFQAKTPSGREQKYVGPETPELLERIAHHRQARDDEKDRRSIVSALVRSAYLPAPQRMIGNIIAALARAGVFRLRSVMVGTSAYQTYSAMLGTRLPRASMQTGDVDIAQYTTVSVAIEDTTPPMLDVLRAIDPSFRAIPDIVDGRRSTNYVNDSGVGVDFLTPNQGAATGKPQRLPALGTDGFPLRFLDFLIHEPESAVVLHGNGIYVHVPSPHRFALHKLIIAQRRKAGDAKKIKDIIQAEALLQLLTQRQPGELKRVWDEAWNRGKTWRNLLCEGLGAIDAKVRDMILEVIEKRRAIVPRLDLRFDAPPARYDAMRGIVVFEGLSAGKRISCAVSREAIDDHFAERGHTRKYLECFMKHREEIEGLLRRKFLNLPVEASDLLLLKSRDIEILRPA
ncbi:GSU2403 family nucleotidyltransferase fold protein [Parvibaculum sp.]|uniref:GSU2403 family nucleotidyltransferase fold protein n=1 Tax=Parvibaculum sp. TaxID=2024848 RepID=UPI002B97E936|nr:GSU2403 family nucleotidyltransferase fold protein [Parvibaculum sp.]HUD52760.1 GSU2403 family nucleotidyltransferase fold protein [Parvibaculum sp.]